MSAEGLLDDPALFVRKNDTNTSSGHKDNNNNERKDNENENKKDNNNNKKTIQIKENNDTATTITTNTTTPTTSTTYPTQLSLALEYIDLVEKYPVKMKSVIFHVRRICRVEFTEYQLIEECMVAKCVEDVR